MFVFQGNLDDWSYLIVSQKYETILNLQKYDIEDYLVLYEMVLINTLNEALKMASLNK